MITKYQASLLCDLFQYPESFPARIHGNGFIQVDLDKTHRLHIWDHRIPRQEVSTQIHDHRFQFTSTVLVGRLVNVVYFPTTYPEFPEYKVYSPVLRQGEDTVLVDTGDLIRVRPFNTYVNLPHQQYTMFPEQFHETMYGELTVTLMEKTLITDHMPRVLVPRGEQPDNDFNRYHAYKGYDATLEKVWDQAMESIWLYLEGLTLAPPSDTID